MNDIQSSRGSKLLFLFILFSIIFAILLSFTKYYLKNDFLLYIKEPCNPQLETCFLHECEEDDVRCSSLKDGKFYYKILYKKEYNTPPCASTDCQHVSCGPSEEACSLYFCSDATLEQFDLSDTCSK